MSGELNAVDVLAVMDHSAETFARLNRQARSKDDHLLDVEDAKKARAAVAELIEAATFLSAELLRKHGGSAAVGESRLRVALALVGGAA